MSTRSRTLTRLSIVIGFVLILAVGLYFVVNSGTDLQKAEKAVVQGDWTVAERHAARWIADAKNQDDAQGLRILAKAQVALGRGPDALEVFQKLGPERMELDDYASMAQSLASGRPLGSWCAWEAVRKRKPGTPEVLAGQARVSEVLRRSEDDYKLIEKLGLAPSAEALGVWSFAFADSTLLPVLKQGLSLRPNDDFATVQSALASRQFLARTLLESSLPDKAEIFLKVTESDGESLRLMSRVLLQKGDRVGARKALDQANAAPGVSGKAWVEPSPHVGAASCRECHREKTDIQQASPHATTVLLGSEVLKSPTTAKPVSDPERADVKHQLRKVDDQLMATVEVDGQTYQAVVVFVMGSGRHGRTAVIREPSGQYHEHRVSWYRGEDVPEPFWDRTNRFSPEPHQPQGFLGRNLSYSSAKLCLNCHTTRALSIDNREGPEVKDRGIGCERCHGPGKHHVLAAQSGWTDDLALSISSESTAEQRMKTCAQCHSADPSLTILDPEYVRFQSSTLPLSPCYQKSRDRMDCTTCHDPHKAVETSAAYYESRCVGCHKPPMAGGDSSSAKLCPVEKTKGCLNCHMPKKPDVMPHTSYTDHYIRAKR